MEAGATWTLPATASSEVKRTLYFHEGTGLRVDGSMIEPYHAVELAGNQPASLKADGEGDVSLLLLQGRPIEETVVQYGPFVMNTRAEIQDAFEEYQRTRFGGWPWDRPDPVHPRDSGRFARYADGSEETREEGR
jgi:redox-sensitive bicupin YhaK (pirin superfamily)